MGIPKGLKQEFKVLRDAILQSPNPAHMIQEMLKHKNEENP